jgi:hypothetical protein
LANALKSTANGALKPPRIAPNDKLLNRPFFSADNNQKKTALKMRLFLATTSGSGGNVSLNTIGTVAEKVFFNLFGQVLAVLRLGQTQSIFIDDHRLQSNPLLPSLFRNVLENPLTQGPGVRCEIHAFGFTTQFDAINHPRHCYFSLQKFCATATLYVQSFLINTFDLRW